MNSEARIMRDILLELGAEPDLLIARNHVGSGELDGRYQTFGWPGRGGPDLMGVLRLPSGLGMMFCLECKTRAGRLSSYQVDVMNALLSFGAFYAVVRSVDEARAALERARKL